MLYTLEAYIYKGSIAISFKLKLFCKHGIGMLGVYMLNININISVACRRDYTWAHVAKLTKRLPGAAEAIRPLRTSTSSLHALRRGHFEVLVVQGEHNMYHMPLSKDVQLVTKHKYNHKSCLPMSCIYREPQWGRGAKPITEYLQGCENTFVLLFVQGYKCRLQLEREILT